MTNNCPYGAMRVAATRFVFLAALLFLGPAALDAAEPRGSDINFLAGKPAEFTSSAYEYRADRKPEENSPESWIGVMKYARLPLNQAVDVKAPALRKVLCGLIWEEVRRVRRLVLAWNGPPQRRPTASELRVTFFDAEAPKTIPTWWNETVLREAGKPEVSADGSMYTFTIPVDTFGLVVSLRGQRDACACEVPTARAFGPDRWKKMKLEIEWGFDTSTAGLDYSGRIETYDGVVDRVRPLEDDAGTTAESQFAWVSVPKGRGRRGIRLALLYQGTTKWRKCWPYNADVTDVARTIVTVWTRTGNFSFLASDLEQGPILAPEYGFFVRAVDCCPSGPNEANPSEAIATPLLDHKIDALLGNPSLCGWGAGSDTPWFVGNATDRPATVRGITIPAHGVAMHPGSDRDVGAVWNSPIDGRVSVTGSVAHAHPSGGDGIEWSIVSQGSSGQKVLARGAVDRGGEQRIPSHGEANSLVGIAVSKGDRLALVVGRRGNHSCDSTAVKLVIAELGGLGRTWDLAKDVADHLPSGSLLGDSFGNRGVWSFVHINSPPTYQPPPMFKLNSPARSAREFLQELAARDFKTVRQRLAQHAEQTWDGAMEAMFPQAALPAIPKPAFEPPMKIEVPCEKLTAQWNLGAWHLARHAVKDGQGRLRFDDYPYPILASETYLVLHALDLVGMHQEAADGLHQWLGLPLQNKKPAGLFSEGNGCFTDAWGPGKGPGGTASLDLPHGMGPGAIMLAMTEHFRRTGDLEWLRANAPRMKANVEWILRQRRLTARMVPGGDRLWCKGLQPAHQVTPDSGGQLMQFYESEAYYWLAVQRFAEILAPIDPEGGARFAAEAEAYRRDLKAAMERSITLSPVTLVRDGTYRSFIPFACYVRGFASGAWSWRRPGSGAHVGGLYWDTVQSADPLVSPAELLPPDDRRVQGHLAVLEDRLLLENPKVAQRTSGFDLERHWFAHAGWQYQPGLERRANLHLAADDVPDFLRSWLNQYAVLILPEKGYTFREHTTGGPPDKIFEEAAFLERFRDMLVMEQGEFLWLARATPRAWFEQGQEISVKNSPTHFGTAAYAITSDVDNGKIGATVDIPCRKPPKAVLLRLRHPKASRIRAVAVNSRPWTDFDPAKEVIRLHGVRGTVKLEARY